MMKQFKKIEYDVLQQIIPANIDRKNLSSVINELFDNINSEIRIRNLTAIAELVGSTAKDTYLRNSLDIDIFLLFQPETNKQFMTNQTISIGKIILQNTQECYAEHPYIRGTYMSYMVELVPSYQIKYAYQKLSSVDRTPLHTSYIKEHITDQQKQEVRLFKQFLHGIGCYGAEASIQGFSGYLCEILILRFGTFDNLLMEAIQWKPGTKLSLINNNIPEFQEILIMIDPVDPERNVASAIAKETFELFQEAAKTYLKTPSLTFFFPNPVTPWSIQKISKTIKQQSYGYIGIGFPKPNIIDENLFPQLRKACRSIEKACSNYGFKIYDVLYLINNSKKQIYIIIKTDKEPIPEKQIHMGPLINLKSHEIKFLEKWKNSTQVIKSPYTKNGRWYVDLRRQYTHIAPFLSDKLPSLSLGKHLETIIKKYYFILDGCDLFKEEFSTFWTKQLDGKQSWER